MRRVLGFSVTNLRVAAEFLRNWVCGREARVERRAGVVGGRQGEAGRGGGFAGLPGAPRHAHYVQEPVSSGSEGHLRTAATPLEGRCQSRHYDMTPKTGLWRQMVGPYSS